jgi:hypothetical protein
MTIVNWQFIAYPPAIRNATNRNINIEKLNHLHLGFTNSNQRY